MGIEQRMIQERIDRGELVAQCIVTGRIRGSDGHYHGFRFKEPYENISHSLSPEWYSWVRSMNKEGPR